MDTVTTSATPTDHDGQPRHTGDLYDRLRWDIVHGVLRPNEALVETELAQRLGVSRTPVRESLLRLAADGLIVTRRRRWYVYEHSAAEIREIYEVRAAQEGYAARLTCERATDEQLDRIAAAAVTVNHTSAGERVAANDMFHDLINAACGNHQLMALITKSRLFHFNVRLAGAYTDEELTRSSQQHTDIVSAITARDGDRAETIVRQHVLDAAGLAMRVAY